MEKDCLKCKFAHKSDYVVAKYLSQNSLPFTVAEFRKILERYHADYPNYSVPQEIKFKNLTSI